LVLASTGLGYVGIRHFHHPEVNWAWDLVAVDDNQLTISVSHGACDQYRGYRVREDQSQVVVSVRMRPWRTGYCTANLSLWTTSSGTTIPVAVLPFSSSVARNLIARG
jgi:hypothetical protein